MSIELITCPACHHSVSPYARSCPSCGHPIATDERQLGIEEGLKSTTNAEPGQTLKADASETTEAETRLSTQPAANRSSGTTSLVLFCAVLIVMTIVAIGLDSIGRGKAAPRSSTESIPIQHYTAYEHHPGHRYFTDWKCTIDRQAGECVVSWRWNSSYNYGPMSIDFQLIDARGNELGKKIRAQYCEPRYAESGHFGRALSSNNTIDLGFRRRDIEDCSVLRVYMF